MTTLLAIIKYVNRPKRAAVKAVKDIDVVYIDIGPGDIDPPLLHSLRP